MNEARLLYFRRRTPTGRIEEYIVLLEDEDNTPTDDHCIFGFELVLETRIQTVDGTTMPSELPYSETLMKR